MDGGVDVMAVGDFEEVAALWREVGMWPHEGEDRQWWEAALLRNPGCALVWREGGAVVGTVMGAWDGVRGWIYHLAVSPLRRGQGIGSKLLAAVEQRLQAAGVRQINLMVYEGELDSLVGFYSRRGYEPAPVRVMRKRLPALAHVRQEARCGGEKCTNQA